MIMQMSRQDKNVILGGFFSRTRDYTSMRDRIENLSGQETQIIPIPYLLWFGLSFPSGWAPILNRLGESLCQIRKNSPGARVTLIGHSIGGVLGLLFLIASSSGEGCLNRREAVHRLITLGSPHSVRNRWLHGGSISRLVGKLGGLDGLAPEVHIACIAGAGVLGKKDGTSSEKKAFRIYRSVSGEGNTRGDGIVPVSAAHPHGTEPILLDNVVHFSRGARLWYGSPEAVSRWWPLAGPR
jgi:pimeloyl-ACP methyl ester carboxylesterase